MQISGRVRVDMKPVKQIVKRLGIDAQGDVQAQTTKIIMHRITRYMPYRSGALSTKLKFMKSPTEIEVLGPYAHFQYEGKLWVDPDTGSPYAPRYKAKVKTKKDLDQTHGTKNARAGPHWDRRLMAAEGAAIAAEVQAYVNRKAGRK